MKPFIIIMLAVGITLGGTLLEEGNQAYETGEIDRAIQLYNKALKNDENSTICYLNLGNAFYRKSEYPESIVYYRLALEQAPDFYRARFNLAMVYAQFSDLPGAIVTAETALELKSNDPQLILFLASIYREMNSVSSAIAFLEKNISLLDTNPNAVLFQISLYREIGEWERAVELLNRTADTLFEEGERASLLGGIYRDMGELHRAELAYRSALSCRDDAQYNLVSVMAERGHLLSAILQAEQSLRRSPDHTALALFAASLAVQKEWYEKAEQLYMIALHNGSAEAHVALQNLAKLYRRRDEIDRAKELELLLVKIR